MSVAPQEMMSSAGVAAKSGMRIHLSAVDLLMARRWKLARLIWAYDVVRD